VQVASSLNFVDVKKKKLSPKFYSAQMKSQTKGKKDPDTDSPLNKNEKILRKINLIDEEILSKKKLELPEI
jgi:hypothetical protein